MTRFRVLKHRVPRVPMVAFYVGGKKIFDKRYSTAIRSMWKVGSYGV